jgi:hypothetical protein
MERIVAGAGVSLTSRRWLTAISDEQPQAAGIGINAAASTLLTSP